MNLWIFATSDDVEGLSLSLRSRFMDLELEEHSYKEFMEIVRRLLKKRYRLEVRIAKLAKSPSDVDWLIQVHKRYGKK